jgi:hypothetical protein
MPMVILLEENFKILYKISSIFVIQFPDGEQEDIIYSLLAEHLYSQVDNERKQYSLFKEIIKHRRAKAATDKADQWRILGKTGKREKKHTTTGWDLEVEWKDGSTSWIHLKELKETNPVDVVLSQSSLLVGFKGKMMIMLQ